MKILVVSDTHGNNAVLDKLVKIHPDCDLYLHAGDSESDEQSLFPFRTVRGNCDYFTTANERLLINTPKGYLLMQHKPNIPSDIISEYDVKIFIHGHTHIRRYEIINNLIILNPGAMSYSRDKYDCSYAIVTIDNDDAKVNFFTL